MSSVRPMQRTRGPVRPQLQGLARTSTWSRVRKRSSGAARWRRWVSTSSPVAPSSSSSAASVAGSISSAWTKPRAPEVHAVLRFAFAPERHADVADPHRLRDPRAPALLERRAESRFASAGLAGDEHSLDARGVEIELALCRPLDQIGGVGGSQHGGLGSQQLDRAHEALGVAGSDRDVREADAVEGGERGTRRERAGVVGADDPLAGRDAGGRVAACRAGHPVVEVARGQRDVAGCTGRSARRVDPDDLPRRDAEMGADRFVGGAGGPYLAFLGERQAALCRPGRRQPRGDGKPAAVSFSR